MKYVMMSLILLSSVSSFAQLQHCRPGGGRVGSEAQLKKQATQEVVQGIKHWLKRTRNIEIVSVQFPDGIDSEVVKYNNSGDVFMGRRSLTGAVRLVGEMKFVTSKGQTLRYVSYSEASQSQVLTRAQVSISERQNFASDGSFENVTCEAKTYVSGSIVNDKTGVEVGYLWGFPADEIANKFSLEK